tara:strand:- start:25320 stop:27608 length:2289 start_codon:yes stop_codon:yes gene_type:complete
MVSEKGELISKDKFPVEVGLPSPSASKRLWKSQVKYRNFAGVNPAMDLQARTTVINRREQFRAKMSGPMKRWAVNWSAANTEVMWQEREDDVHMPETKKALEGKVARIEEAVAGFDPVFEAEGVKGEVSRHTAKIIGNFVYRKMEMAEWKRFIQPLAKDGELCNVMAVKVQWDKRIEEMVERSDELAFNKRGMPEYHTERRLKEVVARDGVKLTQIDPFWFIYDLEADTVQDCAYIGDESLVFLHELKQMAELGVYSKKAVAEVEKNQSGRDVSSESDGTQRTHQVDQLRRMRSIASDTDYGEEIRGSRGADRIRVIEMWMWYDFGDGSPGITSPTGEQLKGVKRVVITTANGTVIRFQENPFDRKFVPYAFAMVNRNGHELVAPAPFDSVVQMNANYDRLSSNIMRWMDLAVSPLIVTNDQNTDLPSSILDVRAGSVLKNSGQWDWVKVPDITAAISYQQQFFRREIEETSGNLRVFESPQGTATETERKVQEQQRMVRNSIRANGDLWRQVAHLVKGLEAQFSTGPTRFQVSGKESMLIGRWAEITPQMLYEDVDFRFLGLTDIHVFGNRLQGMAQLMNRWGPMLPNMPKVNMMALFRLDFELSVGRSHMSEVIPNDPAPWESWSQNEENAMLMTGQSVEINDADDDKQHIDEMMPVLKQLSSDPKTPQFILEMFGRHLESHMSAMSRKADEQKAQQQQAESNAELMAPQGGEPGVDRPPVAGGMEAGQKDVTPGSPQARTQPRTGRDGSGMSQTQAMTG